jgi:hypothetical protein
MPDVRVDSPQRVREFDAGVRTARNDAEGRSAVQALWRGAVFQVFEIMRLKRIDEKAFVGEHFMSD